MASEASIPGAGAEKSSEQHVSELLRLADEQRAKSSQQHVSELIELAQSRRGSPERRGSTDGEGRNGGVADRRHKDVKKSRERDRDDSGRRSSSRDRHHRSRRYRRRSRSSGSSSDHSRHRRRRERRRHRMRRRSGSSSSSRDRRERRRYHGRSGDSRHERARAYRPAVETYNIDYRPKHSRSEDADKSSSRIDKQHLLEVARRNVARMAEATGAADTSSEGRPLSVAAATAKADVHQLTAMCRRLRDEAVSATSESGDPRPSAPFAPAASSRAAVSEAVVRANSIARTARVGPVSVGGQKPSNAVTSQFPVSSGEQHRVKERHHADPSGDPDSESARPGSDSARDIKVDLNQIVADRLSAMRDLQKDPNDADAKKRMQKAVDDMRIWTGSDRAASNKSFSPSASSSSGHFTGSTGARLLSAAELASGQQAWVKKDQLRRALPISGGLGQQLMMKMGWRPGSGLGRRRDGVLEPVLVDVKTDKRGLVAENEGRARKSTASAVTAAYARDMGSKNPISVLMEHCMKNQWPTPAFDILQEKGPPHKRLYIIKVVVNGQMYRGSSAVNNKKVAKAEAAVAALRALGLVTPTGGATVPDEQGFPPATRGVQQFTSSTVMYSEFSRMGNSFVSGSAEGDVARRGTAGPHGADSGGGCDAGLGPGGPSAVGFVGQGSSGSQSGAGFYQENARFNQMEGYDMNSAGYYQGRADYSQTEAGYDTSSGGFGQTKAGYDASSGGFGQTEAGYDTSSGGFGQTEAGYDTSIGGFGQTKAGYDSSSGGYDQTMLGYSAFDAGSVGTVDYAGSMAGQLGGSGYRAHVTSNGNPASTTFPTAFPQS